MSKLTFTNHAPILIDDRLPPPGPGSLSPIRITTAVEPALRFLGCGTRCTCSEITTVSSSVNPERCGTEDAKQRSHRMAHLHAKGHLATRGPKI